jgi:hypothetical protein
MEAVEADGKLFFLPRVEVEVLVSLPRCHRVELAVADPHYAAARKHGERNRQQDCAAC